MNGDSPLKRAAISASGSGSPLSSRARRNRTMFALSVGSRATRSSAMNRASDGVRHLVVSGNGMAGARLVENVLARGGGDTFRVTIFGDEPCGNYNRILLSGVLAGSHSADDSFLNP